MGSYVPRSPDLSALDTYPPNTANNAPHARSNATGHPPEPFTLPSASHSTPYEWPAQQFSKQYQPPVLTRQSRSASHSPAPANAGATKPRRGRPPKAPSASSRDPDWLPTDPPLQPGPYRIAPYPQPDDWSAPSVPQTLHETKDPSIKHETEEDRKPAPGEVEGIVVKTKFPVARIKRIVQADEEVGKVAQVTPVVVSKALELFMISLTLKSAAEARASSSRRVTSAHLKHAVAKDERCDFLSEIVEKIPDTPASKSKGGAGGGGGDSEDADMDDAADAGPKRGARAGGRRRRKQEDSDD